MGLRLAEGIDPSGTRRSPAARSIRSASRSCAKKRDRVEADRPAARHAGGFPVLDAVVADLARKIRYAPKLLGEPATGTLPPVATRMTARPRHWRRRRGIGTVRRYRRIRTDGHHVGE